MYCVLCVLGAVGCVLCDVTCMLLVRARTIDYGGIGELCIEQGRSSRSGWVRELVHVLTRHRARIVGLML